MAAPSFLRRATEFLGLAGPDVAAADAIGPIREGSPESDEAGPPINQIIVRSEDSWIMRGTAGWLDRLAINDDTILQRHGTAQGLKLYDHLLDDDTAVSALQQRRLAITSRDWEVAPGDPDDPLSVQAADDFRQMLDGVGFDRLTGHLHYAVWYGYAVGECLYQMREHDGRTIVWLDDIVIPDRRWFGFTVEGELRYTQSLTGGLSGEVLPDNKFVSIRTGGSHDFAFYGIGLAHWCYWPIFFKRSALKFWSLYLEKFGMPTVAIEFDVNDTDEQKAAKLSAAVAVGQDRAVLVPKGTISSPQGQTGAGMQLIEAERSGTGASSYKDFVGEQNDAIDRVILGQMGTTRGVSSGLNSNQADVHQGVKQEIVKADSDLISDALNRGPARWITRWNYGPDVKPPKAYRVLDDAENVNSIAERDTKLDGLGWQRTDESFREVYGDGYDRKEPVAVPAALGGVVPDGQVAANDDPAARRAMEFGVEDATPLYVRRDVLNAGDIAAWARRQGIPGLVPNGEMHVTILYSKTPVDWFAMGSDWGNIDGKLDVPAGGPRAVERFGDNALVLRFASSDLRYRHENMIERGASSDYPEYKPHVTLSYDVPEDFDLSAVEPYAGPLHLGPEVFEPIRLRDPGDLGDELGFSAADEEAIDRLTRKLVDETDPVFAAMADELRKGLMGVTSIEGARVAILQAVEQLPIQRLGELTALPMLAARAGALAGAEAEVLP